MSAIGLVAAAGDLVPGIGHNGGPALAAGVLRRAKGGAPASGVSPGFGNDGTGTPPAGTAVTPATFRAALVAASPGDTLVLAQGTYDWNGFNVNNFNKGTGPGVTIYGQTGVFCNTIDCHNSTGLHFKYFTATPDSTTPVGGVYFVGCDNCSADHFDVIGDPTVSANRRTGAYVRTSTNVAITNFNFSQVANGVITFSDALDGSDNYNIDIVHGHIQKYIENALLLNGAGNIRVAQISIKNYDLVSGGHADLIQVARTHKIGAGRFDAETGTNYGILIEDCYGDGSIGSPEPQAIGFTEDTSYIIYRRNCSFSGTIEGMSLSAVINGVVYDNFMQGFGVDTTALPPGQPASTRIIIRDGSQNITLTNNYSCQFVPSAGSPAPSGITPNTGPPWGSNTIIPVVASSADRSYVDPWLTAHPTNIGPF